MTTINRRQALLGSALKGIPASVLFGPLLSPIVAAVPWISIGFL